MYLSVIIPAKNEEKHIKSTVESIHRYLSGKNIEHEIIVVTDGSTDKTDEIVQSMLTAIPALQLINYPKNRGKGYAVRQGMLKAKGEYRLFTDADNATSIDQIEKFFPYFKEGYGVVIGSIGIKGAEVAKGSEPAWRRLFGNMGNFYIQILAVPGIQDTQRGFKMVTAKAAQDIFPKMTIDRWAFDVEMLALAIKFGHKIKEVPVKWKNDPNTASHPKLGAYFKFLMETAKVRWNLLTGKYNAK